MIHDEFRGALRRHLLAHSGTFHDDVIARNDELPRYELGQDRQEWCAAKSAP